MDVFLEKYAIKYAGKRIGLVTNMTGVNEQLVTTIDLFYEHPNIELTTLYGPEHGIRGDAKEGEKVSSSIDPYTNLPVYSLYGENRKPSKEMLAEVDVIVFDLQDLGSRYYTYIYTMAYVMKACAESNIECVILDRPNPISGDQMEGNLVADDVRSFVGLYPIPNRHGMTIAELALFFNHEFSIKCDLTVVPMDGWKRSMYFDDTSFYWVPPSPNTTSIDMSVLYTGTCLVEGTNLSEGRGTTQPFECIGAPFIDGHKLAKIFNEKSIPGVLARPTSFIPTYQKHKDILCHGIQLHIVDRKSLHSLQAGLTVIETIAFMYPDAFEFVDHNNQNKFFFDLLAGTKSLREQILTGKTEQFLEQAEYELSGFKEQRKPYLLYS